MTSKTIVCISDTHSLHEQVNISSGDILIHAGDITNWGDIRDLDTFNEWIGKLPHKYKIVIAGNHDFCCQENPIEEIKERLSNCIYLQDEMINIEGINFYGSPWQPWFGGLAFNLPRNKEQTIQRWNSISEETDILITHGPPFGILDVSQRGNQHTGCTYLRDRIFRSDIKVHIFGHIHESYGIELIQGRRFINASTCTLGYEPTNEPIVFKYVMEY